MRSVTFFNFLLESTLMGSLLILLVMAGRALLRRRASRIAVYAAWLLVAVRLLLPFSFPNPLMNELRPRLSNNYAARPIADQVRVRTVDAMYNASKAIAGDDVAELAESPLYQLSVALRQGQLGQLLLIIYLGGTAGALGVLAFRNLRFRQRLKKQRVALLSGEAYDRYLVQCRAHRVRPRPVWLVEGIPASCAAGFFHARIALPAQLSPEEYDEALAHELLHVRMGDAIWNLVRCLCCALHWFNPLVWLAASLSRADAEYACDELALRGHTEAQRKAYVNALSQLVGKHTMPELGVQASSMLMKPRRVRLRQELAQQKQAPSRAATITFCIVSVLLFAASFFTDEQTYTPSVEALPSIAESTPSGLPRVQRHVIDTEETARAWFTTLFSSPFLQADLTAEVVVEHTAAGWSAASGKYTADFNTEGVISAFTNGSVMTATLKDYQDGALPEYTNEDLYAYLQAFCNACLPDVAVSVCRTVHDRVSSEGRFLTCEAGHDHTARAYRFVVQVSPVVRVVSFALLDNPSRAFIRVSTMEQADVPPATVSDLSFRITMSQALEIARDRVDRARNGSSSTLSSTSAQLKQVEDVDCWIVSFRTAGELCYEVTMDAATGEVLRFTDLLSPAEDEEDADTPTPRPSDISKAEAIALARAAVAAQYSFTPEVAATFLVADVRFLPAGVHWLDYWTTDLTWYIAFRRPDTDVAFISDYDVMLDAATGEVMVIFDPSNNANG